MFGFSSHRKPASQSAEVPLSLLAPQSAWISNHGHHAITIVIEPAHNDRTATLESHESGYASALSFRAVREAFTRHRLAFENCWLSLI
jgi:hypothetical protein